MLSLSLVLCIMALCNPFVYKCPKSAYLFNSLCTLTYLYLQVTCNETHINCAATRLSFLTGTHLMLLTLLQLKFQGQPLKPHQYLLIIQTSNPVTLQLPCTAYLMGALTKNFLTSASITPVIEVTPAVLTRSFFGHQICDRDHSNSQSYDQSYDELQQELCLTTTTLMTVAALAFVIKVTPIMGNQCCNQSHWAYASRQFSPVVQENHRTPRHHNRLS